MRKAHRQSPLPFPSQVPFVEQLGLELHSIGDGHSDVRVDLAEGHHNAWAVAHGGLIMTMLDVAMATAARSGHPGGPQATGVATIEMKSSFMRPAEGELRALGKLLHRTATLAFCSAELLDEHGRLCASATGTFKYLRALPSRGRLMTQTLTADPSAAADATALADATSPTPAPNPKDIPA